MKIKKLKEIYYNFSDKYLSIHSLKKYIFISDKCLFIDNLRKKIYFFDFNDYDYDYLYHSYGLFRINKIKIDDFCKNKIIENSRFILKQKLEKNLTTKNKTEKRSKI